MKYRCIPCDHVFESTDDAARPRCPRCMGIHDLEPVDRKPPPASDKGRQGAAKRSLAVPVIVVLVLGGLVAAYFLYGGKDGAGDPISADTLTDKLIGLGVPAADVVIPFQVTDATGAFAKEASGGEDDAEGLAAMIAHIGKMRQAGKWAPYDQREARGAEPMTADALLEELGKERAEPLRTTSYEMAVLLLAAARSLGIDAHMAQIHSFNGEKKPADPGGKMGRFGVTLGKGDAATRPPLFDPYALRHGDGAKGDFQILPDEEAVAVFYGHRALSLLMKHKTSAAHEANDIAVKLAPGGAMHRVCRGLIFAASGAPTESLAEFEKAVKRRGDPVNRVNLADVLVLTDPTGRKAEAELQAALAEMPDFVRARAGLAAIFAARGEFDEAEAELGAADRLEPDSPEVAMSWAGYYARRHMGEEAIAKAQQAVRLSSESMSSLLGLAGVYRATARFDDMRATLDKVLAMEEASSMTQEIKAMFGYEPEDGEIDAEAGGEIALGEGDAGPSGMKLELETTKKKGLTPSLKLGGAGLGGQVVLVHGFDVMQLTLREGFDNPFG